MAKSFYNRIKNTKLEREVEFIYKEELEKEFTNSGISHPHKCDGYIEEEMLYDEARGVLRLIMEFKYIEDFNKPLSRGKVLVQILFYIKKFKELKGEYTGIPNIILAGDKITCFVIHGEGIYKYLDRELNWSIEPSKAPNKYLDLVNEIAGDESISPYIFNINKDFKFNEVTKEIRKLLMKIKIKYKIDDLNIIKIYDCFINNVVKNSKKYSSLELVNTFINLILDDKEIYQHPKIKGILCTTENIKLEIDNIRYRNFESIYSNKYTIKERQKILEYRDRLIEDTERRNKGEFYTPTIWAERADRAMKESIGSDWKERCIVWDCAWGTGNMTRDYYFDNLYCSTLRESDIRMGKCNSGEGNKFVYDFLNDGINVETDDILLENSIPDGLKKSIKQNKEIVFYINPPFGEASNYKAKNKKIKSNISKSKVSILMANEQLKSQSQLYAQFLYRIIEIKKKYCLENISVGIFMPALFFTGPRFEKLRSKFNEEFEYKKGFMFNASNFSNVSNEWAITFTVWNSKKESKDVKNDIVVSLENINNKGVISKISNKKLYSIEKKYRLSEWIKKEKSNNKLEEQIKLKSALNIEKDIYKAEDGTLGYLINDSNNVYGNSQGVYLINSKIKRHIKCITINEENIDKAISIYAARAIIKSNWTNQTDEYFIPNSDFEKDNEWLSDAYIYSIFSNKSNQSSLRNIEFNNKIYNIFNEFFFISSNDMYKWADECGNLEIINDIKKYNGERFLYNKIKNLRLSDLGEKILQESKILIEKSMEYREEFNYMHKEYNINSWDAGWYQIKGVLKAYFTKEVNQFNKLIKILENNLEEKIYKLGFLKR